MAHYAGDDPLSVGMYWLDTLFGMGFNSYELVPGYDCPAYATYLPMTFHQGEKTVTRKNSLCVFEWTASDPIQVSYLVNYGILVQVQRTCCPAIGSAGEGSISFDLVSNAHTHQVVLANT
jgi:hypothetical protein